MGRILCATRGGEDSHRTQDAAIALARESGDELIFFIVFDMGFMTDADYALRSDVVSDEIDKLCEFLMLMAVERASEAGIQARYLVRQGRFRDELVDAIREEGITRVVLGHPGEGASRFEPGSLGELCSEIEANTGAACLVLP